MTTAGRITLRVRTEFDIVRTTDITKYEGQESIAQVAGLVNALAERVVSRPPSGYRQVYNIYWDPDNEEFVIEVSETSAT